MSARKTLLRCVGMVAAAGGVLAPSAVGAGYCRAPQPTDQIPALGSALSAPFPDLDPLQDLRATLALEGMGAGADGRGVRVADLEYDWDTGNVELDGRALPGPAAPAPAAWVQSRAHGTATLSVIGGEADGAGISGIAPAAALLPRTTMTSSGGWDPAGAIRRASGELRAGDVLLIEQQGSVGAWYVPLYAQPGTIGADVRAAIAEAVARDIVVVVPAGNGQSGMVGGDLGATGITAPAGAVVVGAGKTANTGEVEGARAGFSNYGADVDVQGPGMGVLASDAYPSLMPGIPFLGTFSDNPHSSYTNCFNGTSSASAVVAGGIASLQGVARQRLGRALTPAEVEARLVRTGVPQPDPQNGNIGPQPRFRLAADFTPPAAATNLVAVATGAAATLTWTSPADAAGGSGRGDDVVAVDGQVVARVPAATGTVRVALPAGTTASSTWTVTAEDRAGNASPAAAGSFTTGGAPEGDPATGVAVPEPPAPAPVPIPAPAPMPVPTPVAPPTATIATVTTLPLAASRPRITLLRRAARVRVAFAVTPRTRLAVRDRGARITRRWVTLRIRPARVVSIVATAPRTGRRVTYRVRIDSLGRARVILRRVG